MPDFDADRLAALVPENKLAIRETREVVRTFFLNSIKGGEYRDEYRAYHYDIETELMDRLLAFHHPDDVETDRLRTHNLKLIRRFLLHRYAFGSACKVDKHLKDVSTLWLCKDYVIPRIGLSLVIGFGGAMGSSAIFDWLGGLRGAAATIFAASCLSVVLFLVYLNVRDVITGAYPSVVWRRTLWVFTVALAWAGIAL